MVEFLDRFKIKDIDGVEEQLSLLKEIITVYPIMALLNNGGDIS